MGGGLIWGRNSAVNCNTHWYMYKYSLYYINMSIVDYFEFIYLISNFELKSRLCDPLYLKKNYNYTNPFFSSLSSCSKYLSTWSNNSILTCPNLTFNHIINNAVNGFQMVISGISSIRNLQLTWEQLLFFSKQIKQITRSRLCLITFEFRITCKLPVYWS